MKKTITLFNSYDYYEPICTTNAPRTIHPQ